MKTRKKPAGLHTANPRAGCGSACCRYLAVHVDAPSEPADLDVVRWYLHHKGVCVSIDREGDWYVQVGARCRQLGPGVACRIYEKRPDVCREYSRESCERSDDDAENVAEFETAAQFDAFAAENFRQVGGRLRRTHRSWRTP